MNPFDIRVPRIMIAKRELLFEQYIMALNPEKYDIEIRYDDAIRRNRILFDFMPLTFNLLDELYLREGCVLIDAIMKDQLSKQSAEEIEKPNREKRDKNKRKEGTSKTY